MSEFKTTHTHDDRSHGGLGEQVDAATPPRTRTKLPVTNWSDYKAWCEHVKQNWEKS